MQVVVGVRGKPLGASPLLVLPVGDALQEPFWPQGLGINRGVLAAQDACWIANLWDPTDPASWAGLLAERNHLCAHLP